MEMDVVYDVSHNMAKVEEHIVGGKSQNVVVHRKGATRSFPALSKDDKFWIDGDKLVYKIPFVTFLMVGYAIVLTLSLLRLV